MPSLFKYYWFNTTSFRGQLNCFKTIGSKTHCLALKHIVLGRINVIKRSNQHFLILPIPILILEEKTLWVAEQNWFFWTTRLHLLKKKKKKGFLAKWKLWNVIPFAVLSHSQLAWISDWLQDGGDQASYILNKVFQRFFYIQWRFFYIINEEKEAWNGIWLK